jgi:antitoxin (DNA-binding transcriptional repressor) of toxin-antitoxin stability system
MKTASVTELGQKLDTVLGWVKAGEQVELLEGDKQIAVISPTTRKVQHPDYMARLKKIFGDKVISPEASAEIRELMRGDR